MLQYDWHSSYTSMCLFGQWCTIFLGEEWLILFLHSLGLLLCAVNVAVWLAFIVCINLSICAILRNFLWYGMGDFTSPYYQAVAVCIECCSMTGIHCTHQLSICLYLLERLIFPYYLAIAVGGGCCSMTGIHRMQYNTWEHD